jgi:hypothetical protein
VAKRIGDDPPRAPVTTPIALSTSGRSPGLGSPFSSKLEYMALGQRGEEHAPDVRSQRTRLLKRFRIHCLPDRPRAVA